jgi:hypothetical protein
VGGIAVGCICTPVVPKAEKKRKEKKRKEKKRKEKKRKGRWE